MLSFGDRLKRARKEKKLTQEEVAKRLGIDDTTISKYENDKSEPDNKTLNDLAGLYEVSVDYLLGRTDDPKLVTNEDEDNRHPAEILLEYVNQGLTNEEIKKRMDFVVDIFKLSNEEVDSFMDFVRWQLSKKGLSASSASKSEEQ